MKQLLSKAELPGGNLGSFNKTYNIAHWNFQSPIGKWAKGRGEGY